MPQPSKYDNLSERVTLSRLGANVERCHTHPHHGRYSVGHHSLGIVALLTLCWKADHGGALPRAELLVAAAYHDVPEYIFGDMRQPAKEIMGEALDRAEDFVLAWLDVPAAKDLTEEERDYLAYADRVELYLWCLEQIGRGDLMYNDWVEDYDRRWVANPPPPSLDYVRRAARERGGMPPRISYARLKEIARI